jgi:hypothetical protein
MLSLFRKIRDRGLLLSFEILFNRLVPEWLFRFSVGDVLELDLPQMRDGSSEQEAIGYSLASVEEAQQRNELRRFTWNSVPLETTHNDFGYSIRKSGDNEPVLGGVWAARENFIEAALGFRVVLESNQSWLYCAYVDQNTRGLGIYKKLLAFVGSHLTSQGFDQLLVVIQPWNKASMRVHQRFARKKIGRIVVLRLLRLSFVFCTGAISKSSTLTFNQISNPVLLRFT